MPTMTGKVVLFVRMLYDGYSYYVLKTVELFLPLIKSFINKSNKKIKNVEVS